MAEDKPTEEKPPTIDGRMKAVLKAMRANRIAPA